jgi:DNA-binding CsgD family transcriptional regulator
MGAYRLASSRPFGRRDLSRVRRFEKALSMLFCHTAEVDPVQLGSSSISAVFSEDGRLALGSCDAPDWLRREPIGEQLQRRAVRFLRSERLRDRCGYRRLDARLSRLAGPEGNGVQMTLSAAPFARRDPLAVLTDRQRQVAEIVGRGATVERAAVQLGISAETVRTHLRKIYARLGIRSRSALRAWLSPPAAAGRRPPEQDRSP